MKLLICTHAHIDKPSAAINRLRRMASSLLPHDIHVSIAGPGSEVDGAWQAYPDSDGTEIAYNPSLFRAKRYSPALTSGAQAARFFRENLKPIVNQLGFDGIIAYGPQAQLIEGMRQGARESGVFIVADQVERYRMNAYYLLNGVYWEQVKLCNSVLPKLDGVIGISKGWEDWATSKGIPTVWIPSFAEDHGAVRQEPSPPDRPFTMTFVGHWIEREMPRVFLKAMRLCLDRGIDVRMNVLGKVESNPRAKKSLKFLRSDPVLREHVNFLGFVSDKERDCNLAEADAFIILRSDCRETDMLFPTRLPEYMLTGNPLILSETGSFRHCFEHRKDVWFVPKTNRPEEVASAIEHLATNPEERLAIGRAGRESALAQFSPEVLGARLAGFLKSVAGSHASAAR